MVQIFPTLYNRRCPFHHICEKMCFSNYCIWISCLPNIDITSNDSFRVLVVPPLPLFPRPRFPYLLHFVCVQWIILCVMLCFSNSVIFFFDRQILFARCVTLNVSVWTVLTLVCHHRISPVKVYRCHLRRYAVSCFLPSTFQFRHPACRS